MTHEVLRAVFDETMKSNNDDGSWVGSPRNRTNAPTRTRLLSRATYSRSSVCVLLLLLLLLLGCLCFISGC